ncbi:MAG: nucleotidyl transferase AbiEii/AbiGii toxin family protein [Bacteroidetes bacterium]|nr:nucleotidyl transferase AbiEii/AbiGii toxin family protein [Bacteroidota bacterium]
MTNTLFDISGKFDVALLGTIELFATVCSALETEFLLVGAVARDIHFLHRHGINPGRATADIDFAVLVPSWGIYEQIMKRLTLDGKYTRDEKMTHRVFSQDGVMLDVLPFGMSEERADEIGWPPHFDHVMSTLGFREALECSMKCQLKKTPPLHIRVASLAGIAVLKLIAWADSYPTRKRDAVDLRFILAHYDSGNIERLYSPEEHLFSEVTLSHACCLQSFSRYDLHIFTGLSAHRGTNCPGSVDRKYSATGSSSGIQGKQVVPKYGQC